MLADPTAIPSNDPRSAIAPHLTTVRDAMIAYPEMVAGTHDRLDTSLMKALSGQIASKTGAEGLRGVAILPGPRSGSAHAAASGLAVTIEDGDGFDRASGAASIEALHQAGVVGEHALRELARYHRPPVLDPRGRAVGEAVPDFDLAPVGELIP
jgi:L-asparaginase II